MSIHQPIVASEPGINPAGAAWTSSTLVEAILADIVAQPPTRERRNLYFGNKREVLTRYIGDRAELLAQLRQAAISEAAGCEPDTADRSEDVTRWLDIAAETTTVDDAIDSVLTAAGVAVPELVLR